jgi:arylsulfatase
MSATSEFAGRIGRTVAESEPHWPQPEIGGGPNVLLVIFDDTGWSDFGCFGSEIATPTVDGLAARGLRYGNFHVTPLCSPTRACVLTGRNHHAVGMRFLAVADTGFPNSRGRIDPTVPTLPQMLRDRGYGTYLVGKWHLTPRHEITPAGPFGDWPLGRGFDKFYGFQGGCTDQFAPELFRDNQRVQPAPRAGYHLSADLVDEGLRFVDDHVTYSGGRPFFLQLAFGATHAPFQAPREFIEPYVKVFEKGWDRARLDRLARQVDMGLVPAAAGLSEPNPGVPAWDSLPADDRLLFTHLQAAYAGFLEHADAQLGRMLEGLRERGVLDDTLVIVMSDNGASREGGPLGAIDVNSPYGGHRPSVAEQLERLDLIGGPRGPAHYPEGWAMAGNTPFRRYKQFVDLGGVRSPLVVCWPKGIAAQGAIRQQFVHAIDIAPTVLSLIAPRTPADFDGASFAPSFDAPDEPAPRDTQYWETLGHRAIRHGRWRAVTEHESRQPFDDDAWRLYDLDADFCERNDLSASEPGQLEKLKAMWWEQARRNQVLPLDDRTLVELIELPTPASRKPPERLVLRPGAGFVPFSTRLSGSRRLAAITARLRRRDQGAEGMLLASGSAAGGYALSIREGRLWFEHHCHGRRVVIGSDVAVPLAEVALGVRLSHEGSGAASATLFVADSDAGTAVIHATSNHLSFFGLCVGADHPLAPASQHYRAGFDFPLDAFDCIELDFQPATRT